MSAVLRMLGGRVRPAGTPFLTRTPWALDEPGWAPDGSREALSVALTMLQRRVLGAVVRVTEDGWPIQVREVVTEIGHRSLEPAHRTLVELESMGLVETCPRRESRRGGWRPTHAGVEAATA